MSFLFFLSLSSLLPRSPSQTVSLKSQRKTHYIIRAPPGAAEWMRRVGESASLTARAAKQRSGTECSIKKQRRSPGTSTRPRRPYRKLTERPPNEVFHGWGMAPVRDSGISEHANEYLRVTGRMRRVEGAGKSCRAQNKINTLK